MTPSRQVLAASSGMLGLAIALGLAGVIVPMSAVAGTLAAMATAVVSMRGRWFLGASAHSAAATALLLQCVAIIGADVGSKLDSPAMTMAVLAVELLLGLLTVAALVAVSFDSPPWAVAGSIGWALGWACQASTMVWLLVWLSGARDLGELPAPGVLVEVLFLVSGAVLGAAVAARLPEAKRRTVLGLVAGYVLLTAVALLAERRLLTITDDIDALEARRLQRDVALGGALAALAAVAWLGGRWREGVSIPSAHVTRGAG